MDDLQKSFDLATELFSNQDQIGLELLYSFSSEVEAKEYFQHIYHPEHSSGMIQVFSEGEQFVCGFCVSCNFDLNHIRTLKECYSAIAGEYGGKPNKLRFRKNA